MLHSARISAHHTPVILRTHGEVGARLAEKERGRWPSCSLCKPKSRIKKPLGTFFLRLYSGPVCYLTNTLRSLKSSFIRINAVLCVFFFFTNMNSFCHCSG